VIPLVAAALLAAGGPGITAGAARYRVEIAGAGVGVAVLSVECGAARTRCGLRWESSLRLPVASGAVLRTRRIATAVDAGGRLLDRPEVEVDGVRRPGRGARGTVPLTALELALAARGGGCVEVVEEESGKTGRACGRLEGGRLRVDALGVVEEVAPGEDGFPDEVAIPAQATRFVRDAAASVPEEAPLLEVRVPGPEGRRARRFCGRAPDAPARPADLSALPAPVPDGSRCQVQADGYAAELRARGIPARTALGVAHDGEGFVWHAWVEARTATGWVAIDPAFGQLPARGPRFTVARHGGDAATRDEAGRRILECWGTTSVE